MLVNLHILLLNEVWDYDFGRPSKPIWLNLPIVLNKFLFLHFPRKRIGRSACGRWFSHRYAPSTCRLRSLKTSNCTPSYLSVYSTRRTRKPWRSAACWPRSPLLACRQSCLFHLCQAAGLALAPRSCCWAGTEAREGS